MERELREIKAAFAVHQEQVGVQVTNLSALTSTLFSEQNSHIGNRMSEFLQNLEERPIPWNAVLDDYERRIKALEEKVCKCADTKPWIRGSGTQRDPLELVDDTGGEGTWKPVITCWVHLELMCIFPTM